MPQLDKETTTNMTPVEEIRNVQLNEKISETTYQILHPETSANQVITNSLRRFVSDEDKARWDQTSADNTASIQYKGAWSANVVYNTYDLVYYKQDAVVDPLISSSTTKEVTMFYICIRDNTVGTANAPDYEKLSSGSWVNIDFRSYLASQANTVRTVSSTKDREMLVTFVLPDTGEYKTINIDETFKYNPSTNTLTVTNIVATKVAADDFIGDLTGTASKATVAEKFVEKTYDQYGIGTPTGETPDISYVVTDLQNKIDNLNAGGVNLKHPLNITKDGENAVSFNGSREITVDIKQKYATLDITDLTENQKIKPSWLPDSVMGQLSYKGTFDPSEIGTVTPNAGDYYIASADGNYNPSGNTANTTTTEATYYQKGDWAVYNGSSWDKIDNTDAVTMVNSRIGAVETYQGEWKPKTQYYRGDIVKHVVSKNNSTLYVCHTSHNSATSFLEDNWEVLGRVYEGEGVIDVTQNVISHKAVYDPTSNTTDVELTETSTFNVPVIATDSLGHIQKIDIQRYTLGSDFVDTTRPVYVDGDLILSGQDENRNQKLDLASGAKINVSFANNQVVFDHAVTGKGDLNLSVVTNSTDNTLYAGNQFTIPSIKIDAYGHVTGENVTFTLASSPFKHSHFNITTEEGSKAQVIGAYGADVAKDSDWVNNNNNALKFYLGSVNPTNTTRMNFNGIFSATKLLQAGQEVLDSAIKLFNGTNYAGQRLEGAYDAATKTLTAPDTGIAAGVYSAVAVNAKGLITAGGHIVEFGTTEDADPSDSLVIGGLYFRPHTAVETN